MGFFKKIFKGVKKFVKKIGRGIKKTFMKVGKFMNKIGIVGQIALSFILPGVGTMLGQTLSGLGTFGAGLAQGTNVLAKAAGTIIKGAADAASWVGRTFRTVSSAVTNHVGEFAKTAASKLGFNVKNAATNFFGADGAFAKAAQATGETWRSAYGSLEAISKSTTNVVTSMANANAVPTQSTIKAEDLFGSRAASAQPTSLFTPEQKWQSLTLDPELGMSTIKDMVTSGDVTAGWKPTFSSEITDAGLANLPQKQKSLLGRIGDEFVAAKDRGISNIQDKITDFQERPLETSWDMIRSGLAPEESAVETGGYPGMVADVLPMHHQGQFVASPLYTMQNQYGNAAYLMDNMATYSPTNVWHQTMRNLVSS